MNKRIFLIIVIFSFTFLAISKEAYSQCTGANPYSGSGNWVITGSTSCRNENFAVNGNISVDSSGELYISNSTIRINGTADGNFFNVNNGGYLEVNESSNLTTESNSNYWFFNLGDRTNITNANISYAYQINASDNEIRILNSNIKENENAGIYINANSTLIWNNTITTSSSSLINYGIFINSYKYFNNISYNYIYNLTKSGAIGIYLNGDNHNNSFYNNIVNITQNANFRCATNCDNNTLYGNYFSQAYGLTGFEGAVYFYSTSNNNILENNTVNGSSLINFAILNSSTNNFFKNNIFTYGNSVGYDFDEADNNVVTGHTSNNTFHIGFFAGSDNGLMDNSTIDNGWRDGCFYPDTSCNKYTEGIRAFTGGALTTNNNTFRNISISKVMIGARVYSQSSPIADDIVFDNITIRNVSVGFVIGQRNVLGADSVRIYNSKVINATGPVTTDLLSHHRNVSLLVEKTNDLLVVNTILDNSRFGGWDVNISYDSNVTFLNVTFDKSRVTFGNNAAGNDRSNLTVKWSTDVKVLDDRGLPIPNAVVQINDVFGNLVFSGTTDNNGLIPTLNLTEYTQNRTYTLNFIPYTFSASSLTSTSITESVTGARMANANNEIKIILATPSGRFISNQPVTVCVNINKSVDEVCIDTLLKHRARINFESIIYNDLESTNFTPPTGIVYKYFEINKVGISDVFVDNATIRFRVNKSWLIENGSDKNNISLQKYTGTPTTGAFLFILNSLFRTTGFAALQIGPWLKNDVTIISETDTVINYESSFRDLSTFAITGETLQSTILPQELDYARIAITIILLILVVASWKTIRKSKRRHK